MPTNHPRVQLVETPIQLEHLISDASHPDHGAIASFVGTVRTEGMPGNPLVALEYSAYDDMAVREMAGIREEAMKRFEIGEVLIVHRIGRLAIGEPSVAVVVGGPHRVAVMEACRWVIDTLNVRVPICKMEIWQQGESTWVDPSEPGAQATGRL
jgi:molybdopterin synthase catalytic subunit